MAVDRGLGAGRGGLSRARSSPRPTARRRSRRATSLGELLAIVGAAGLVVSGDTGPLHLAAALGTPIVGIYGPTDPARNGPWSPADVTLSRNRACACHHQRRCTAAAWCLGELGVDEVSAAVDRRLGTMPDSRAMKENDR